MVVWSMSNMYVQSRPVGLCCDEGCGCLCSMSDTYVQVRPVGLCCDEGCVWLCGL